MSDHDAKTKPHGAESLSTAGLGLIVRLRDWGNWSESQGEDALASLLSSAASEIERLHTGHDRYETARRMNPQQWTAAWKLNLSTGKPFDEIIDDMRPFMRPNANVTGLAPAQEKTK